MKTLSSRITAAVSAAVAGILGAGFVATAAHADSTRGGTISRSEVMARAQYWLDHQPGPYNQGEQSPGPGDGFGYRRDCSGYVAMAWHLNANPSTGQLGGYGTTISKADLKPGDALNSPNDHALIFKSWADSAHTRFNYYSFGSTPVKLRTNVSISGTIDGDPATDYVALRYRNIADDGSDAIQRHLADVTGDGYSDLLAAKADGTLWLYADNFGRDGVPYGAAVQVGQGWGGFSNLVGADVTGDGYRDVVATKPDGTLWLYANNFERDNGQPYSAGERIGQGWGGFNRIVGADVTGDGFTDLIATKPDGTLWLYANNIGRDGTPFNTGRQIGQGWAGFDKIIASDINGDGFTDLIATKPDGTLWQYFNNIGRDGTPFNTGTQIGQGWAGFTRIVGADYTGDGYTDLVATKADGTLWTYPNNYGRDGVAYNAGSRLGSGWNAYTSIS